MEHSETEGDLESSSDHQDQSKADGRNEQPVENKQTVEESGIVGAKSGADDQSVPPAGREGETSQNEQQTAKANRERQVEQMIKPAQMSNRQSRVENPAKESSQHNYMYLLSPLQTMYKFLTIAPSWTSQILWPPLV